MRIGFVGLGKMGGNMVLRLVGGGHQVVGDALERNPNLANIEGVELVDRLEQLVSRLQPPRVVWVMVPAGEPTETVIDQLAMLLQSGDIVVDGGNSDWQETTRRNEMLNARGISLMDVGVSGGLWGRREGYCLMVGGPGQGVERCRAVLDALAAPGGWAHVGRCGAGHFVKAVHDQIEGQMLDAYAGGFEALASGPFEINPRQLAGLWNHGSVIRSWLLELAERVLTMGADLRSVQPYVEDGAKGRRADWLPSGVRIE